MVTMGDFLALREVRHSRCGNPVAGRRKRHRGQWYDDPGGDSDTDDVSYITSRLAHSSACLLAWSVSDSTPAGVMAAMSGPGALTLR